MGDISDLDRLVAENVRSFELTELRRRRLTAPERERMLDETLGPRAQPLKGESFVLGDATAGITSKSIWFEHRRIHFAVVVSIAVGELRAGDDVAYCIDVNCTLRRSYRITVPSVQSTDSFLVGLSQFMSFKLVPTIEDEMREERRKEELAAEKDADVERRHRRMEHLARRQNDLLHHLIQIEAAPRVTFGVLF